jgi:hypothetical protein
LCQPGCQVDRDYPTLPSAEAGAGAWQTSFFHVVSHLFIYFVSYQTENLQKLIKFTKSEYNYQTEVPNVALCIYMKL